MTQKNEHEAVFSSLDAFKALRDGLGYLRSISACFVADRESQSRQYEVILRNSLDGEGKPNREHFEQLTASYFHMTVILLYALLYSAIQHYMSLAESNPELKHRELEATLEDMGNSGLLETMRQLRNAVFHIRPNENIDDLVEKVREVAAENQIGISKVEELLYDATEQVFRGTEIFRKSPDTLHQAFTDALAYYDDHIAEDGETDHLP